MEFFTGRKGQKCLVIHVGRYENRMICGDCIAIVFDLRSLGAVIVRFARIRSHADKRIGATTPFGNARAMKSRYIFHAERRGAARTESTGP